MQSVVNRTSTSRIKQKLTHTLIAMKWQNKKTFPQMSCKQYFEANGMCGVKKKKKAFQPKNYNATILKCNRY